MKGVVDLRAIFSCVFLLIVFLNFPSASLAAPGTGPVPAPGKEKKLVVGIDPIPPFAIRTDKGQWHGISWAIWHLAALRLGWTYEIKLLPSDQIIPALSAGEIDIAATAYGITKKREEKVDFTVPYYFSAFGVATAKPKGVHAWTAFLKDIFSSYLLKPVLILTVILLFVSILFWLCERRKYDKKERPGFFKGVGNAFLLSSETMTTVGYGENVPRTNLGRIMACVWMFVSIILLTSFTASVTSSLTTIQLRKTLYELDDLHRIRLGCLVPPSRSALYLQKHGITHQSFDTVQVALKTLSDGKLDAVVYDLTTLHYLVRKDYRNELIVLPQTFDPQFFALPLPPDSPLRRPLNKAILEVMEMPIWQNILVSYIGEDAVPSMLPFIRQISGQSNRNE